MENKISVILGNLSNTCDRFCPGYKNNPSTEEMLTIEKTRTYVEGIELEAILDIRPDNTKDLKKRFSDLGMTCVSIIPDTFTNKDYAKGSFTSISKAIRRQAVDYCRQMSDIALEMECETVCLWLGQDGYDYLLTTNYDQERTWMLDALLELGKTYPSLRFALEYKPKEPRNFSYMARMADTILAAKETGYQNMGICIDTGHSFSAGENVGEAIVLARRAGDLLFHMHFNDNHGSWDDDMIVGSVHSVCYIEMLYWLKHTNYKGWLSMDQYPYREDAADAIGESILWLKKFEKIVDENYIEIEKLVQMNDAIATSRFLRKVL